MLALLLVSTVPAQFVVVPNANAATNGGGTLNTVLRGTGNPRIYQMQMTASELAGIPVGAPITGLAFRAATTTSNPASWPPAGGATWTDYTIEFSQAANAIGAMSTTFTANQLTPVVVRNGLMHIPAGTFPNNGAPGPNPWGFEIPIVPYAYAGGDLVITIRHPGSNITSADFVDTVPSTTTGPGGRALSASLLTATVGSFTTFSVCRLTAPTEYQQNQAQATMALQGVQSDGATAAIVTACSGPAVSLSVGGNLILYPYDLAVTVSPLVPRSNAASTVLGDSQVMNVNLGSPTLFWVWGGVVPGPTPLIPFTIPLTAPPGPLTLSGQVVVVDPASASLLRLSQGCQLDVLAPAAVVTLPGPIFDDSFVTVNLTAPVCPGSVPFYGTAYTSLHVISNGRLMFGTADADFSATLAEAALDSPFVGCWTDFLPNATGTITITQTATDVTATWSNVRYFTDPTTNSFSITVSVTGAVAIANIGGIQVNPTPTGGSDAQMLGVCAGTTGVGPILNAPFPFGTPVFGGPLQGLVDFWTGTAATAPGGIGLAQTIQSNNLAAGMGRLDFTAVGTGYTALNH